MLAPFVRVLRVRRARPLVVATAAAWLAFSSLVLALVLTVSAATGSFRAASLAVALFALGASVGAPLRGRLVDRAGAPALVAWAVLHALAIGGVAAVAMAGGPAGALIVLAAAAGLLAPPLIASIRPLWRTLLPEEDVRAGYGLTAAMADVAAVVGPPLAAVVAVVAAPGLGLAACGVLVLAAAATVARNYGGSLGHPPGAVAVPRPRGISGLAVTSIAFGVCLGALELGFPLAARAHGHSELAAVPLAALAAGSVVGSLLAGSRFRGRLDVRFAAALSALAALLVPATLGIPFAALTLVAATAGVAVGVVNVCVFELLDRAAPASVEALTWITTAESAGLAAGAALAGRASAEASAFVPAVAGATGAALLAVGAAVLNRVPTAAAR